MVVVGGKLGVAITSTKPNAMGSGSRRRVSAQVGGMEAGQSKASADLLLVKSVASRSSTIGCSGLSGYGYGLQAVGYRLAVRVVRVVPCRVVSCLWAIADRQRQDTYHAYLGRHAADIHPHPHQNPHPQHTAPINQSVSQSPRIESYRVSGGAACLHHAARRSLKSPPADPLSLLYTEHHHCCCRLDRPWDVSRG